MPQIYFQHWTECHINIVCTFATFKSSEYKVQVYASTCIAALSQYNTAFWGSVFFWILVLRANYAYYHTLVTMSVDTFVCSHIIKKQMILPTYDGVAMHVVLLLICQFVFYWKYFVWMNYPQTCHRNTFEININISMADTCVLSIICGKSVTFSTQFLGRTHLQ